MVQSNGVGGPITTAMVATGMATTSGAIQVALQAPMIPDTFVAQFLARRLDFLRLAQGHEAYAVALAKVSDDFLQSFDPTRPVDVALEPLPQFLAPWERAALTGGSIGALLEAILLYGIGITDIDLGRMIIAAFLGTLLVGTVDSKIVSYLHKSFCPERWVGDRKPYYDDPECGDISGYTDIETCPHEKPASRLTLGLIGSSVLTTGAYDFFLHTGSWVGAIATGLAGPAMYLGYKILQWPHRRSKVSVENVAKMAALAAYQAASRSEDLQEAYFKTHPEVLRAFLSGALPPELRRAQGEARARQDLLGIDLQRLEQDATKLLMLGLPSDVLEGERQKNAIAQSPVRDLIEAWQTQVVKVDRWMEELPAAIAEVDQLIAVKDAVARLEAIVQERERIEGRVISESEELARARVHLQAVADTTMKMVRAAIAGAVGIQRTQYELLIAGDDDAFDLSRRLAAKP